MNDNIKANILFILSMFFVNISLVTTYNMIGNVSTIRQQLISGFSFLGCAICIIKIFKI